MGILPYSARVLGILRVLEFSSSGNVDSVVGSLNNSHRPLSIELENLLRFSVQLTLEN